MMCRNYLELINSASNLKSTLSTPMIAKKIEDQILSKTCFEYVRVADFNEVL